MSQSKTRSSADWLGLAKMLDALAKGADARRQGLRKLANPYPTGSDDWADWAVGWEWIESSKGERQVVQLAE